MRKLVAAMIFLSSPAWAAGQPTGEGDPAATSCMRLEKRTGSAMAPAPVCKTNAEWAQMKAENLVPSPDGKEVVKDEHLTVCVKTGGSGPVGTSGIQNFNVLCR